MVSIRTESLRGQADVLYREALHYSNRFLALEECISWVKRQEFDEANEIYRVLTRQYEELAGQKKELILMSEAMRRICDKYDTAERKIVEGQEVYRKPAGYVGEVNLKHIRSQLSELGIHLAEW